MSSFNPGDTAYVTKNNATFLVGETVTIVEVARCGAYRAENDRASGPILGTHLSSTAPTAPKSKAYAPGDLVVLVTADSTSSYQAIKGQVVEVLKQYTYGSDTPLLDVKAADGKVMAAYVWRFRMAENYEVNHLNRARFKPGQIVRLVSTPGWDGIEGDELAGLPVKLVSMSNDGASSMATIRTKDGREAGCFFWRMRPASQADIDAYVEKVRETRRLVLADLCPQAKKVLRHMLEGNELTRLHAMFNFKIANVTARITDLRNAGVDVGCVIKRDPNGNKYGAWSIGKTEVKRVTAMMAHA